MAPGQDLLSIPGAADYLHLPKKAVENYVKDGREIPVQLTGRTGKIRKIRKADLDDWKKYYDHTTVALDQDDYFEALQFALEKFYSGAPRANFATSQQREAGKYLSDHISGFLGETAFQVFLEVRYGLEIKLDKNVDGLIRSQDIVSISRRRGVENQPSFKMSIKSSKMKNVWLIVGKNEVDLADRRSDYYVFVRVDLYPDHIVRLLKEHPGIEKAKRVIPDLESHITAQVCGFAPAGDLEGPTQKIGTQDISPSYVKRSGELRRDWEFIADKL